LDNEHSRRKIFREVYILKKLKSRFVVKILEVFENNENFLIVMEYMQGGDLLNYLKLHGKMSEDQCKKIFYQVVLGVQAVHKHGILHRDIKLDNILLDKSMNHIKICDFGVSKLVHKGEIITDQCGTPAYLAPEIVLDKGYEGFWSDIWSLGVLLYCMVCGTVPFKANNLQDLHKAILVGKFELPEYLSANLKHLIRSVLVIVPNRRMPIEKILKHRWFDGCESLFEDACYDEALRVKNENLAVVESFGYPKQHVINSLGFKSLNHAYAVYNMINLDY
jgi:serine/threonine-protein kinase SIK2